MFNKDRTKKINGNMKRIFVMAALVLTVLSAGAQKNVIKAFDDLMNEKSVKIVANSSYVHPNVDNPDTYCYFTSLRLPKKNRQADKMWRIQDAFGKDALTGYKYVNQTPKARKQVSVVGYGPNLEYSVKFGTKNHNYLLLFVYDKVNTLRRYVYACVWYEDSDGICCMLYRIYGNDPAKVSSKKLSGKLSDWSFNNPSTGTTTIFDGDEIRVIRGQGGKTGKSAGGISWDTDINDIKTDTDFMMMFGNLRVAFLDAIKDPEQKALQTGIVVKLLKLCREHHKLITANERTTCVSSLYEMKDSLQKTNADTFITGMLNEALFALGK